MFRAIIGFFKYSDSNANLPVYYKPPADEKPLITDMLYEDCYYTILANLGPAGLNAMARVDRYFNNLTQSNTVYRRLMQDHFPTDNKQQHENDARAKFYYFLFKETYLSQYYDLSNKQMHFLSLIKENDINEIRKFNFFDKQYLLLLKENQNNILLWVKKYQNLADYLFVKIGESHKSDAIDKKDKKTGLSCLHWLAILNPTEKLVLDMFPNFSAATLQDEDIEDTPLYIAISYNNLAVAKLLLERGAPVNLNNQSLMYIAAQEGWLDGLKLIFKYHPDLINWKFNNEFTPLYIASQRGRTACVEFLLANGAAVDIRSSSGSTPFYIAAQEGHVEALKVLHHYHADIEVRFRGGFTPLYVAARNGHIESVKFLISCRANLDVNDGDSSSPCYVAAQNGHHDIVALLVVEGANVEVGFLGGYTALYVAAQNGHAACVQRMLAAGADPMITYSEGYTPAYVACQKGHVEVVKLLIPYIKNNINHATGRGATCLYVAAQRGHVKIVELLLAAGADANVKFQNSYTALHIACAENRLEIVKMLVNANPALLDEKDLKGKNPLECTESSEIKNYLREVINKRLARVM